MSFYGAFAYLLMYAFRKHALQTILLPSFFLIMPLNILSEAGMKKRDSVRDNSPSWLTVIFFSFPCLLYCLLPRTSKVRNSSALPYFLFFA